MALNFSHWLYKTYLDLSEPNNNAPLHVQGVEYDFLNLSEDMGLPRIQSVLMPSFREQLIYEVRDHEYAINDPFSLPAHKSNPRWEYFIRKINSFHSLGRNEQCRLLWLMNKLCFYNVTSKFAFDLDVSKIPDDAELQYIFTQSRYALNLEKKSAYSLSEFEKIAILAPRGCMARVNASYQMVVQNVKHHYNLNEIKKWLPIHFQDIYDSKKHYDEFNYIRFMTRYFRVAGFLPQIEKNNVKMVEVMDLAQTYAEQLFNLAEKRQTHQDKYLVCAKEMLYPVIESRTKEAMALGDFVLAEERARFLVDTNPNEPRARLHLGQVLIELEKIEEALNEYLTATELAPPGGEIAWYMAGQCYESLGMTREAISAFKRALHYDPKGVSVLESLNEINDSEFKPQHGFGLAKTWSQEVLNKLQNSNIKGNENTHVQPYQHRQFDEKARA